MKNAPQPIVLVVEDEPAQRHVLAYNLESQGYQVVIAEDGEQAFDVVVEEKPDLILLDWMLPHISGVEVCRRLKQRQTTKSIPIIMLSARGEEDDKVTGLDTGADDYLSKPYSMQELMARVRTQLRRVRPSSVDKILSYQDISLDTEHHRVHRASQEVVLGPTEFRLLATFLEKPGRVWTRDALLDRVWGKDIYVDTRTVDVHVGRLRKSLCQFGGDDVVRTVRGTGYALG